MPPVNTQDTEQNEDSTNSRQNSIAERALVFSYFFTTWNARADAWSLSLFLSLLFPDTLLPISIYSFSCSLSCLIFAPFVGWIVDHSPRLTTVTFAIIFQKLLICSSAFLLLFKLGFTLEDHIPSDLTLEWHFYLLVANGSILQVANLVSRISMERDWSSCISKASDGGILLSRLNSKLRFIDLGCDLAAPLVISGISSFWNVQIGMLFVLGVSALSIPLEWTTIRFVYSLFPTLADKVTNGTVTKLDVQTVKMLWRLPVITTCFSVSVLYLSVMTINTVSIAYLLSRNTDVMIISVTRGVSVLSGIASTYTLERMVSQLGLKSTGLTAIWYQTICLIIVAVSFYLPLEWNATSITMFLAGICLSRWGLWTFDLVQQQLIQENVPPESLGIVSGVEISLQNAFQMAAYALTIFWASPNDFWIPSHISMAAVLVAALSYTYFVLLDSTRRDDELDPLLTPIGIREQEIDL